MKTGLALVGLFSLIATAMGMDGGVLNLDSALGDKYRACLCPSCPVKADNGTPVPFDLNQSVELADGEYYVLVGYLSSGQDADANQVFHFELDAEEHPLLQNPRREKEAAYAIMSDQLSASIDLFKFVGKKVFMPVQAKYEITVDPLTLKGDYSIKLLPLQAPILFEGKIEKIETSEYSCSRS